MSQLVGSCGVELSVVGSIYGEGFLLLYGLYSLLKTISVH